MRRVVDGGYAFGAAADSELVRSAAICTGRPKLVIGGPTAARLLRLRRAPNDGLVHVIAPPASQPCRATWVRAYRTAALGPDDATERIDGIRLTTCSRTMVDMTRYLGIDDLSSMLEDVLARGLCTPASLLAVTAPLDTRGRPWVRRFLRVLLSRVDEAPAESEWERKVRVELRRRGVDGLEPQHLIEIPGYGRARFDLAIPHLRWALEIDVHPRHRSMRGTASDNRRDIAADSVGWLVRRVAELQLAGDFTATMDAVVASIGRRRAAMAL